jgi:hypothetical protein
MKPNNPSSPASRPAAPATNPPATPLNLTPEQAKREAAKLRQVRDDLEASKTPAETDARTSPIGRHDE